jgi:hypothetical protein
MEVVHNEEDREVVGFSWDDTGDDILTKHECNWEYSFPESMTSKKQSDSSHPFQKLSKMPT